MCYSTILGGSFTSQLNTNLRETHGYAYGASSQFVMRRQAGPFVGAAGVQTDKTAESVREFLNEFDGIRTPIPADEFGKAQRKLRKNAHHKTGPRAADKRLPATRLGG